MKTKIISILLLLVLIFPTYGFFLGDKMFTFNDETQIANLFHYFKAIDLGQFPPRWAVDMHYEYGSPFPEFNYQLPYYFGYLGHLAGLPNVVIFKLLLAFTVIIGAVGMFLAGRMITGSTLFSLFAGVLYSYTPYQSIDHFVRGALGEVFALALFPWIFLAGYSLLKKESPLKVLLLGMVLGSLILSHQPAALVTLPIFSIIFIFTAFTAKKIGSIISFIKSLAVALLVSAYYWVPVIVEKKFIPTGGPINYLDQFPFIKQLIYSSWSYQGANPFSSDTFSFQIGIVNLLILTFSLCYFVYGIHKKNKGSIELSFFRVILIMTFIIIFLMNIRSVFIWKMFPLLQQIQFPWRMLMFTTWFTPFLYLLIVKNFNSKFSKPVTIILLIASIAINIGYFHPGLVRDEGDSYYNHRFLPRTSLLPGEVISADYLNYAEDYAPLPNNAIRPKTLPLSKLTSVFKSTKIIPIDQNPVAYSATIENEVSETITFHTFNFPGWKVVVDSNEAKIKSDQIGAITIDLSPGKHVVDITYTETPLRLLSNIISLASLSLITLYLIYYLNSKRVTPTT